jgi:lipoyl(octanoyl) transferase
MNIDFFTSQHPIPYNKALKKMNDIVSEVILGTARNTVWFLEHRPVYTVGPTIYHDIKNISVEINDKTEVIPIIPTDRGGKITFHGPGQRIIYIIMNLKKLYNTDSPDIKIFLNDIHKYLIHALQRFNINAFKDSKYPGIWIYEDKKKKKIAAIGMKIRKWVSFHGIALNINTNMRYFDAIAPCGIDDVTRGVVSIQQLMQHKVDMKFIDKILKEEFIKKFNV